MITRLEVYTSTGFNPYRNLAIEKHLLDTVPDDTLRLYLWQNDNTVVIGSNQNPWAECNCTLLEAEGGFVARRLSGGGAVFHDVGNLNFTFICNEENYDLERHLQVIKTACGYAHIQAEVSGRNDILTSGKKFSGNAFYHAKGKAYHHGTLLIAGDVLKIGRYLTPKPQKLRSKGVKSVKSRVINLSELNPDLTPAKMTEYMIQAAQSVYNLPACPLSPISISAIEQDAQLFGSWDYIYGKTPPFSVCVGNRFPWGDVEINLNLKSGKIAQVKVFTDALDFSLAQRIETALLDAPFTLPAITAHLRDCLEPDILDNVVSVIAQALCEDIASAD